MPAQGIISAVTAANTGPKRHPSLGVVQSATEIAKADGSLPVPKTYSMGTLSTKTITNAFGPGQDYLEPPMQIIKIDTDKYAVLWDTGGTSFQFMQIEFDSSGDITWRAEQSWTPASTDTNFAGTSWDGNRFLAQSEKNEASPATNYYSHFDISATGVLSSEVNNTKTLTTQTADYVHTQLIPLGD